MGTTTAVQSSLIFRTYRQKTPTSAKLYERARKVFPSGVTHDVRYLSPHPVFISHARGSHKWDVDGNEYVDYFGGHGALILGHNHPAVVEAVQGQISRGVHFGGSHELELEWAELIQSMIPCAERVRFTVTGTEATHLALRIARAYTGRSIVVRFATHFHGWHDHVAFGRESASAGPPAGILKEIVDNVRVCTPGDVESLNSLCEREDVAAIILEPTGSTFGKIPHDPRFLTDLRRITEQHGIVLIFDEVITGFRCSTGGAQKFYGVTPDLTTLGKVIAGGYPGGAGGGRAEVMSVMDHKDRGRGSLAPLVAHQGTYNAGPISAAAGIATLKLLQETDVVGTVNRTAAAIRDGMNEVIRKRGSDWCVYGTFSGFHIFTNPGHETVTPKLLNSGKYDVQQLKAASPMELQHKMRLGFLCGGVDIVSWPGGLVSAAHHAADVDRTVGALDDFLRMLAEEGALA